MGGKLYLFYEMIRNIWFWCIDRNIWFIVNYVFGVKIVIVDELFRKLFMDRMEF